MRLAFVDSNNAFVDETRGGAEVYAKNVAPRLRKFFDIIYVPSTRRIAALRGREDTEYLAGTLEEISKSFGFEVPYEVVRFIREELPSKSRCRSTMRYLELIQAVSRDVDLFLDMDYWPRNLMPRVALGVIGCAPFPSLALGDVYYFANASGRRAAVVIQGLGDVRSRFIGETFLTYLRSVQDLINPIEALEWLGAGPALELYWRALSSDTFAAVFLLSRGQLENQASGCAKCRLLHPADAADPGLRRYRGFPRGDYIVAASRLVAMKGVLELPRIHRRIRDETGLRLVVTGRFSDESTRRAFGRAAEREGLKLGEDIVLAGFLPKEKYYEVLARARTLVYPSHSDSFSLTILESLAVGTPVVAYDIPGPHSVYGGLPAVRFVREFDHKAMAEEAVRLAKMPEEERRGLVEDERVTSFLDEHSSWDVVAERLAEGIMEAAAAR